MPRRRRESVESNPRAWASVCFFRRACRDSKELIWRTPAEESREQRDEPDQPPRATRPDEDERAYKRPDDYSRAAFVSADIFFHWSPSNSFKRRPRGATTTSLGIITGSRWKIKWKIAALILVACRRGWHTIGIGAGNRALSTKSLDLRRSGSDNRFFVSREFEIRRVAQWESATLTR